MTGTTFCCFFSLFLLKSLLKRPGLSLSKCLKRRPLLEGLGTTGAGIKAVGPPAATKVGVAAGTNTEIRVGKYQNVQHINVS